MSCFVWFLGFYYILINIKCVLTNNIEYELIYSCHMKIEYKNNINKNISIGIPIEQYISNSFYALIYSLNVNIYDPINVTYNFNTNNINYNITLSTLVLSSKDIINNYLNDNLIHDISVDIETFGAIIVKSKTNITWNEIITHNNDNNNSDNVGIYNVLLTKFGSIHWYYFVIICIIILIIFWLSIYICCTCCKRSICKKRYETVNNDHYREDSNLDIAKNVWKKRSRLSIKQENVDDDELEIVGFGLDDDSILTDASIFSKKRSGQTNNFVNIDDIEDEKSDINQHNNTDFAE